MSDNKPRIINDSVTTAHFGRKIVEVEMKKSFTTANLKMPEPATPVATAPASPPPAKKD